MFSAATKSGKQATAAANYIEDVFSTYLYDGTSSAVTINNGIDLSTKGGMIWTKQRNGTRFNTVVDTVQGGNTVLFTNTTNASSTISPNSYVFNTTGYTSAGLPTDSQSGYTYCSWSFRKQPKFFDVVAFTTNSNGSYSFSHSLASTPGMVIIKYLDATDNWYVWHTSTGNNIYLELNTTAAQASQTGWCSPNSTTISGTAGALTNGNYIAYVYGSNAGGFGTAGTDNVISCGSFTTNGSGNATVNLGYEPQYLLFKRSDGVQNWFVIDTMRGFSYSNAPNLKPNTSGAEADFGPNAFVPTATGFVTTTALSPSANYIYMAIRRPMKVPTDATKVFAPVTYTGNSSTQVLTTGFTVDAEFVDNRTPGSQGWQPGFNDRLRGNGFYLTSSSTAAEGDFSAGLPTEFQSNTAVNRTSAYYNYDGGGGGAYTYVTWTFARRPGFFDEVCYTGTGTAGQTYNHNLTVAPELMIVKNRSIGTAWNVYVSSVGATAAMQLNTTIAPNSGTPYWNDTNPTSTVFSVGTYPTVNGSGYTYVAYLFATCPGVSKVGSYTGNGTTQAIACGFTGGARFVLIKRTDSTGDWYVYDTARGMTTLTDPYLNFNNANAETATLGSVTTTTGGFTVNAAILSAINTSGASYIFLAIA